MKINKRFGVMLCIIIIFLFSTTCFGAANQNYDFCIDRTITTDTAEFTVLYANDGGLLGKHSYEDSVLYITSNNKTIFRKKCEKLGYMKVRIKKQPKNATLKIFIRDKNNNCSNKKSIKVKGINKVIPEMISNRIKSVRIQQKNGDYYISAQKGDTVIIRSKNKLLKKINFDKTCSMKANFIDKYTLKSEIYLYKLKNELRSHYIILPKTFTILE